jgi:CubicO group peptidase (beta-lactamase class C family)
MTRKCPAVWCLWPDMVKVAYFNAFGKRDVEANATMQNDAIFRIASQTKALVSVGIMILQEEGKLLIADPVSKYIPEFAETTVAEPKEGGGYNIIKAKRQITLRDLLNPYSRYWLRVRIGCR